ncbi:UNVERIFIED_CONTAM: hypothetical protein FKN15_071877 [Acipenser sinensis]
MKGKLTDNASNKFTCKHCKQQVGCSVRKTSNLALALAVPGFVKWDPTYCFSSPLCGDPYRSPKGAGEGEAEDDDEGREDGFLSGLFRRVTLQLSLGTEPSGQDVATFFTDDGGEPCPGGMAMEHAAEL